MTLILICAVVIVFCVIIRRRVSSDLTLFVDLTIGGCLIVILWRVVTMAGWV